ncbi:nucleotide exchange factor GrpE [Candidatus Giovannonibacteria bacterium]|nr:nucleotide exchange factor GrpE [Candidatus Giovannonibacteria bacterium]
MEKDENTSGQEETLELDEEMLEEEGLKEKLKKIRRELELCRKEKEEYLAGWQRAKADFINARKDEEKNRVNLFHYAKEESIKDFLLIADSLELATRSKPSEGMSQIHAQLIEILKRNGVEPIECVGAKFDPEEHEALEKMEVAEELKDEIVLEEFQKGYRLGDKILRPAKVKVGEYKLKN